MLQSCTCTPESPVWVTACERAQINNSIFVPISQILEAKMRLREQKPVIQSHVIWAQGYHQAPHPWDPASKPLWCGECRQLGRGRVLPPEGEARKALAWDPLRKSWGWPGREGKSMPGRGNSTYEGTVAARTTAWWEEGAIPSR